MTSTRLEWDNKGGYEEANLGDYEGGNGARFSITQHPTCHRRGQYRLLVEVTTSWGCFDAADQPMRWYHNRDALLSEAQAIADAIAPG